MYRVAEFSIALFLPVKINSGRFRSHDEHFPYRALDDTLQSKFLGEPAMTISARSRTLSLFAAFGAACALGVPATAATNGAKILHAFQGGSDGALPRSAVIADKVGNLFGVTEIGGTGTGCNGGEGCGTLFEIKKGGVESVLYSFQGGTNDGISPLGSLLMDNSGNVYGATEIGGGSGCAGFGCGTVFKFVPGGTETVLYAFQGGSDGYFPEGSLISDQGGNLYGVTDEGGNYGGSGCADLAAARCLKYSPMVPRIRSTRLMAARTGRPPRMVSSRTHRGTYMERPQMAVGPVAAAVVAVRCSS